MLQKVELVDSNLTLRGKGEVLSPPRRRYTGGASVWQIDIKSASNWRLMRFSLVTGTGMNFKPHDSKVICSSLNCVFDRFSYFLRDSMALRKLFLLWSFLVSFLLPFFARLLLCLFFIPSSLACSSFLNLICESFNAPVVKFHQRCYESLFCFFPNRPFLKSSSRTSVLIDFCNIRSFRG